MPTYVEYSKIQKEKRGSGNRTRFVHRLKTADADTKIVLFEVYTPSGNWSSYPPHKHDEEKPPKESLLQEFYYYRFDPDKGFALQWNFNDDLSFNQAIAVRNNDMISVPKGYHTVCAAPGYDCYYLNAMAGPTTNWNFTVHPDHVHLQDY
jgi:5-deoxy-glucuronate isomerase